MQEGNIHSLVGAFDSPAYNLLLFRRQVLDFQRRNPVLFGKAFRERFQVFQLRVKLAIEMIGVSEKVRVKKKII